VKADIVSFLTLRWDLSKAWPRHFAPPSRSQNSLLVTTYSFLFIYFHVPWKYWHRAKIEFEIRPELGCTLYNLRNVEKSCFGLSVCLSVCLSVAFSVNSNGRIRINRSGRNFRGIFYECSEFTTFKRAAQATLLLGLQK